MPEEAKFQTSFYADPVDAVFKALGGAMTLTRTNAFDSDGHLRPSQRSELDAFLTVESKNEGVSTATTAPSASASKSTTPLPNPSARANPTPRASTYPG